MKITDVIKVNENLVVRTDDYLEINMQHNGDAGPEHQGKFLITREAALTFTNYIINRFGEEFSNSKEKQKIYELLVKNCGLELENKKLKEKLNDNEND